MSTFTDTLDKATCTICGKEVIANQGHFVTFPVYEGDTFVSNSAEFHCLVCDPIVVPSYPEPVFNPSNDGSGN